MAIQFRTNALFRREYVKPLHTQYTIYPPKTRHLNALSIDPFLTYPTPGTKKKKRKESRREEKGKWWVVEWGNPHMQLYFLH
jgi:hypothetical protein